MGRQKGPRIKGRFDGGTSMEGTGKPLGDEGSSFLAAPEVPAWGEPGAGGWQC